MNQIHDAPTRPVTDALAKAAAAKGDAASVSDVPGELLAPYLAAVEAAAAPGSALYEHPSSFGARERRAQDELRAEAALSLALVAENTTLLAPAAPVWDQDQG